MTKEKEKLYKTVIHAYAEYVKIHGNGFSRLEWELQGEIEEAEIQLKDYETKERNVSGKSKV